MMGDLQFYVPLNGISVILEQWEGDKKRGSLFPFTVEKTSASSENRIRDRPNHTPKRNGQLFTPRNFFV